MNAHLVNVTVNSLYFNVAIIVENVAKYSVTPIHRHPYAYIRIHYNSPIIHPSPWSGAVLYVMQNIKNGSWEDGIDRIAFDPIVSMEKE
jgi:hypothetical protein